MSCLALPHTVCKHAQIICIQAKKALKKKLKQIEELEAKNSKDLSEDQKTKMSRKAEILNQLAEL